MSTTPSRKKDYKKGLDWKSDATKRTERAEQVRKEERDRSFAIKRQQIAIEVAKTEGDRTLIESLTRYTTLQIQEAVEAVGSAIGPLVTSRGGIVSSTWHPCLSSWQTLKSGLPPIGVAPLGCSAEGLRPLTAAVQAVAELRKILSTTNPPVSEVVKSGGSQLLIILFDISCELLFAIPTGTTGEEHAWRLLEEVLPSLGNIVGSDEEDHSAEAPLLFPFLTRLFQLCAEAANPLSWASAGGSRHDEERWFKRAHATVTLLGNLAADYPRIVLDTPPSASDALWDRQFAVLQIAVHFFDSCCTEIVKCGSPTSAQGQEGVRHAVALGHTIAWLLCNLIRIRDSSLIPTFLLPPSDVRSSFNAIGPLAQILTFCASPSPQAPNSADILQLTADNELRVMLGESLWCLDYCCMAEPGLFYELSTSSSNLLIASLGSLVSSVYQIPPPTQEGNPSPLQRTSTPRELYSVDILTPALQILTFAAATSASPRPSPRDSPRQGIADHAFESAPTPAADRILAIPHFDRTISALLSHPHRGILRESCELVAVLASAQLKHTEFVLNQLPKLAELIHSSLAFDIKREVAIALVHLALNHRQKFLPAVMQISPPVVDAFLDLFTACKFDQTTIAVALDFVEGILRCWPNGRQLLFEKGAIETIESVQHLHGDEVFHRIADLIANYFNDLDGGLGLDEELDEEFDSELQLSAQLTASPGTTTPSGV